MRKITFYLSFSIVLLFTSLVFSQTKTTAEKLGYHKDAKLLIIHADDIGVAHSVNSATILAFEGNGISSASIMVPCPWFPEIAAYIKENPNNDFGLHLTLTSEWKNYRWGGISPDSEIPGLLNSQGFLYGSSEQVIKNAKPEEVEKEIRAQVERALAFGIQPTHLDSHMGVLFATPEFFKAYLKVGADYNIPVFVPMNAAKGYPELLELIRDDLIIVDNYYSMSSNLPVDEWTPFYTDIIKNLKPGLNEIIIHLAIDNEESQAIMIDHPDYGATWRQNDFDSMMSAEFKLALEKNNIKVVTWKQIKELRKSK